MDDAAATHEPAEPPVAGRLIARVSRFADRWAPVGVGGFVVVMSLAGIDGFLGVPMSWSRPPIVLVAVACGVAAAIARRYLWPLFVVAPLASLTLLMWPGVFFASYYAGTRLRRRGQVVAFVAAALGATVLSSVINLMLGGYRATWSAPPNSAVGFLVFIGLPLAVGLWVNARRQVVAGLQERAERLEREQAARTEQARAQERARIAREMHDIVAHRVSLMVLHAGAIEVNTTDEQTAREAALIRSTGREALANLREVLGVLRSEASGDGRLAPQPGLADLDQLLDQSRAAGVPVTSRTEGVYRPVPESVGRAAYRVVQEALTNVHKYAPGAATDVVVRYLDDAVEVEIGNTPPAAVPDPIPGSGLGLAGLHERVALLGGSFAAGPRADGGFVVRARLPAPDAKDAGGPDTGRPDTGRPDTGRPDTASSADGPSTDGPSANGPSANGPHDATHRDARSPAPNAAQLTTPTAEAVHQATSTTAKGCA